MTQREDLIRTGPLQTGTVRDVIEARRQKAWLSSIMPNMLGNIAWQIILKEGVNRVEETMLRTLPEGNTDELYEALANTAAMAMGWMDVLRHRLSGDRGMMGTRAERSLGADEVLKERLTKMLEEASANGPDGDTNPFARPMKMASGAGGGETDGE